jgi:hypothetical protein
MASIAPSRQGRLHRDSSVLAQDLPRRSEHAALQVVLTDRLLLKREVGTEAD